MEVLSVDDRMRKYLKDIEWVQRDIWKLPAEHPHYDIGYCEVFSPDIPTRKYSDAERKVLKKNISMLHMFMQGPFWLGEDIVIGGFWNKRDTARATIGKIFNEKNALRGKRILEIGSMSGYDSFYLNLKLPEYYLSIEPSGFYYQALLLNTIYKTNIDFKQMFWQDISAELNGTFDVVLNCGCLYHEADFILNRISNLSFKEIQDVFTKSGHV